MNKRKGAGTDHLVINSLFVRSFGYANLFERKILLAGSQTNNAQTAAAHVIRLVIFLFEPCTHLL
jgi:hypothetical protein